MLRIFEENLSKVAIKTSSKQYSYDELHRGVNKIAAYCRAFNKYRVAVILDKSFVTYCIMWAVYLSGGTICLIDPKAPEHRISNILKEFVPDIVFSKTQYDLWDTLSLDDNLCLEITRDKECYKPPNAIFAIIYTSGSTGEPKGVRIKRIAFERLVETVIPIGEMTQDDICGNYCDVNFDMGFFDVFHTLSVGATLVPIVGLEKLAPDVIISRQKISYMYVVPTFLDILKIRRSHIKNDSLKSLKMLKFGGAELFPDALAFIFSFLPDLSVWNTYGPAETTIFTSYIKLDRYNYLSKAEKSICLGKELPIVKYSTKNNQNGETELVINGKQCFDGYVKSCGEDFTQQINNCTSYDSGDIVREVNGDLFFVCRADNMVKINGRRVYLEEIDYQIRRLFGVAAITVYVNNKIMTVVEHQDGISISSIYDKLKQELQSYMVPDFIEFIDKLPMNANMKYDRKSIKKYYEDK